MQQRRISGIGGLSFEGIEYINSKNRVFWVMNNQSNITLFTKIFQYSSVLAEDPIDFTAGLQYFLGTGIYSGMTYINLYDDIWIIIYSINNNLNILQINPSKKLMIKQETMNIIGYSPEIFICDTYFFISFFKETNLYLIKTYDFETFEPAKSANFFIDYFEYMKYINDNSINFKQYHNVNNYVHTNLSANLKF